jgi:hypothetical protein
VNDDYNMPSGDPPTGFEQGHFEHFMAPEDLPFLVTPTHAASTAVWRMAGGSNTVKSF